MVFESVPTIGVSIPTPWNRWFKFKKKTECFRSSRVISQRTSIQTTISEWLYFSAAQAGSSYCWLHSFIHSFMFLCSRNAGQMAFVVRNWMGPPLEICWLESTHKVHSSFVALLLLNLFVELWFMMVQAFNGRLTLCVELRVWMEKCNWFIWRVLLHNILIGFHEYCCSWKHLLWKSKPQSTIKCYC